MKMIRSHLLFITLLFCNNLKWSFEREPHDYKYYISKESLKNEGLCVAPGYSGGGRNIEIDKVKTPTAEMEANFLASFFDLGKSFTDRIKTTVDDAITTKLDAMSKISRCLGMFGLAFGVALDFLKPDVLDATNKALEKLTDEVNDKFINMKGYVDEKIIATKKETMETKYLYYENMLTACAECSHEHQTVCVMNLFDQIKSDFHSFRPRVSEGEKWDEENKISWDKPDIDLVKDVEAAFVLHRMYCTLYLKVGGILSDIYESQSTDNEKFYYKLYANRLKWGADSCKNYTEFSIKWIKNIHFQRPNCEKTLKCKNPQVTTEGFWSPKHTWDYRCYCIFDGTRLQTERCYHNVKILISANPPDNAIEVSGNFYSSDAEFKTNRQAEVAKQFAKEKLDKENEEYLKKQKEDIESYWNENACNQIPYWEEISIKFDKVINELSNIPDGPIKKLSKADKKFLKKISEKAQKSTTTFIKTLQNRKIYLK